MDPLASVIPTALARLLHRAPLTPEKVTFAWKTVVGPTMARASEVTLDGHVLRVRVSDEAWRREIEHSAAIIRVRLAPLLGEGVVRGLDVTI